MKGKFGRQDRRQAATDRPPEAVMIISSLFGRKVQRKDLRSPFSVNDICHYCKKPGHLKSSCPDLKRKFGDGKVVGLINTLSLSQIGPCAADSLNASSCPVAKGFEGLVSRGAVAAAPDAEMVPISILRDIPKS